MIIIEIALLTVVFLQLILHFDTGNGLRIRKREYALIAGLCLGSGTFLQLQPLPFPGKALYGVLAAYLVTASVTDWQTKQVYDFSALTASAAGILLCMYMKPGWMILSALFAFITLQMVLFRRMYGMADCMAFSICATYLAATGRDLLTYLLHMGAVFLLLFLVQAVRRNINSHGNLKVPVALLPYISATIWFFIP